MLADAHPSEGSRGKNQYPLKSMIPALYRENLLADNFIYGIVLEKLCMHQKPRRGGAGIFSYAAVNPWAASASVNASFFSPLSLPFRSMV